MSDDSTDSALGLVIQELTERLRAGETEDLDAWIGQHPEHEARVRELLPTLQALAVGSVEPGHDARQAVAGWELERAALGGYRIEHELGRGGMGVVYRALDEALKRPVALKILPFSAALDAKQIALFRREARAAARLEHESIVPVLKFDADRDIYFYVMKLIDGADLARVIAALRGLWGKDHAQASREVPGEILESLGSGQGDPVFFRFVARVGEAAARALAYAHERKIVHRDIKPANLLIDRTGHTWVADFGLARVGLDSSLTWSGDFRGTLRYTSPEQVSGGEAGPAADIYALGTTLYELLTLRKAHPGESQQEVLRSVLERDPPPPRKIVPACPRHLETVVLKALQKDPGARYASAGELAEDLRRFSGGRPIRARGVTLGARIRRQLTGRRLGAAVLLLGVVCALGVALAIFRSGRESERVVDRARLVLDVRAHAADMGDVAEALDEGDLRVARSVLTRYLQPNVRPALRSFATGHLARRLRPEERRFVLPVQVIRKAQILSNDRVAALAGLRDGGAAHIATWLPQQPADSPQVRVAEFPLGVNYCARGGVFACAVYGEAAVGWMDLRTGESGRFDLLVPEDGVFALSEDAELLLSGAELMNVHSVRSGKWLATWPANDRRVRTASFSTERMLVATGGLDAPTRLWRLPPRAELLASETRAGAERVAEALDRASHVSFGADGLICVEEYDRLVVRDCTTLAEVATAEVTSADVSTLAASPVGDRFALGYLDGTVDVWTTGPLRMLWRGRGHVTPVSHLSFSGHGRSLTSVDSYGEAKLWRVEAPRRPAATGRTDQLLYDLAVRRNGTVVTEGHDLRFEAWSIGDGTRSETLEGRVFATHTAWTAPGPVVGGKAYDMCRLSPDGDWIALSTPERIVRLHPTTLGREVVPLGPFPDYVYGMGFSRDGTYFAALCYRHLAPGCRSELRVWRRQVTGDWSPVCRFDTTVASRRIAVAASRGILVVGGRHETGLEVRRLHDGERLGEFRAQTFVSDMWLTPDEQLLATASNDGTLELWRLPATAADGAPERVLSRALCRSGIHSIAFFSDSRRLLVASEKDPVRLFRLLETERGLDLIESLTLPRPPGAVQAIAVTPDDGTVLAVGGSRKEKDGWLRVWYADRLAESP